MVPSCVGTLSVGDDGKAFAFSKSLIIHVPSGFFKGRGGWTL